MEVLSQLLNSDANSKQQWQVREELNKYELIKRASERNQNEISF